ncbi:MAG TPA: PEGA domain-containing protein [Patescibacteria group bacterium]
MDSSTAQPNIGMELTQNPIPEPKETKHFMKKQIFVSLAVILFLVIGTIIAILYGSGYRIDFGNNHSIIQGTGLLVATSTPDGAQVFVNGHLTTATNNTINLAPGDYNIKIYKDGYFPWEKKIKIENEVVSKAEAFLFPTTPKLEGITATGVLNPVIDPTMTKIAYVVASQSARKNGIYVLDMANRSLITLQSASTQLTDDTTVNFDTASLAWSPDGQQLVATIPAQLTTSKPTTYLLDATTFNSNPQDVTETLSSVDDSWQKLTRDKENSRLDTLKPSLKGFASSNFDILSWSEDESKILYVASNSATLPQIIKPAIIGADSIPEVRNLEKGSVYVYDTKEDKNFKIEDNRDNKSISWFPDSKHLIVVEDKKINIREYDGGNNTTIYAGPFVDGYVFPWPTADQIVVLTDLGNSSTLPNLYTVGLK